MDPLGPDGGQQVSLEFFDPAGRRLALEGRVVAQSSGAMRLELQASEEALRLTRGVQLQLRLHDPHGDLRFMASVIDVAMGSSVEVRVRLPEHFDQLQARRFRRFDARLPARCTRVDGNGVLCEQYQVETWEIGGKGAGLFGPCAMPSGTVLQFEVHLPELGACLARAEVRYSKPLPGASYQWGIEFTRMEAPDLERLSSFLHKLETKAPTAVS
jgi:PilZ domain